jgi:hypothetical protein
MATTQTRRGISAALRARPGVFAGVALAVAVFDLGAPVLLLSIARKPVDFFTFNPWLRRLPDYLLSSSQPLSAKLAFLSTLKVAWASAEGSDGIDWGFVIDVPTLFRIAVTALLFGVFFAVWAHWRQARAGRGAAARPAGVVGAMTSIFGISSGPCTLAGCGAPVLPVVGLAFSGLPAGALAVFATVSRVGAALVLALMAAALLWLGHQAGQCEDASSSV